MERSAALRDFTLQVYQAMTRGDIGFFEQHTSRQDGVLGIGTDPKEWWAGYETLMRAWRTQIEEVGGGFPVTAGDPQAYHEGAVGWVADRAAIDFPDGPTLPFRLTLVAHQEDGAWKMVQFHLSVGVANEEAVGKELTV